MNNNTATDNKPTSEWLSLFYVVIFALVIRVFLVELFFVPTGSMKFTILEGDYIFSTKYSYGYSRHSFPFSPPIFNDRILATQPERGDIVIFRPPHRMDMRYIKRLIGLPGDKIKLTNDVVYINDKPIKREEAGETVSEHNHIYKKYKETLPNGVSYNAYTLANNDIPHRFSNTETFYVPKDKYFFLGDNRDESNDSRIDLGFVPFENFIAKSQFILFSTKEFLWLDGGNITQIFTRLWTWVSNVRWNRMFTNIYSL